MRLAEFLFFLNFEFILFKCEINIVLFTGISSLQDERRLYVLYQEGFNP